jgi:hypothetical protein
MQGLEETNLKRLYVRDDVGELWFLEDGRIRMLSSEWVCGEFDRENGYPANSWEEAIQILNDAGYIDGDYVANK